MKIYFKYVLFGKGTFAFVSQYLTHI